MRDPIVEFNELGIRLVRYAVHGNPWSDKDGLVELSCMECRDRDMPLVIGQWHKTSVLSIMLFMNRHEKEAHQNIAAAKSVAQRMAGNSFFGFPTDFFDNQEDRPPEVIFGNMHPGFHNLYENMAVQSNPYSRMNDVEKLFMADEFMEIFYYGGYKLKDQNEWLALLGYKPTDFDWDEYRAIYESI